MKGEASDSSDVFQSLKREKFNCKEKTHYDKRKKSEISYKNNKETKENSILHPIRHANERKEKY